MKAQLLQWKRVTSSQHDEPTHKKLFETSVLAIVRLRRTESTTLAMKESHREVIRGNVQKQAKVANITARHWQRKTHNTQAFKPAVCHPRAARRTLRESKPLCATPGLQDAPSGYRTWVHRPKAYSIPLCHGGLPSDWAWKGFAGIKKHNAQHPPNPPTKPAAKPPNNPPINETPPNNPPQPFGSGLQLTKGSCNDKKSLFPIIMIQKTSETKVFGNSAASTYWKRSFCNERETPLPNMMSQPTKNLWNQCVWQ